MEVVGESCLNEAGIIDGKEAGDAVEVGPAKSSDLLPSFTVPADGMTVSINLLRPCDTADQWRSFEQGTEYVRLVAGERGQIGRLHAPLWLPVHALVEVGKDVRKARYVVVALPDRSVIAIRI